MGLSIHYSGCIRENKLIDPLMEEVREICETLEWEPHQINHGEIKGICFSPKGSEPVFLTFDHNGRLLSPAGMMVKAISDGVQLEKEALFTTSTKTQYTDPDAHIAILKLLKYISAKYLKEFTLHDEGNYWESGDETILLKTFQDYSAAIKSFQNLTEDVPIVPGESAESLAERLERLLTKRREG